MQGNQQAHRISPFIRTIETPRIMAFLLLTLLVVGTVFSSASGAFAADTTMLMVKLVNGLSTAEQAAVVARNGGVEKKNIQAIRLHVVQVKNTELGLVLQDYTSDPQVEHVEVVKARKAEGQPNDKDYGVQWALSKIGWESVYGKYVPKGTAKIALLDTGVDAGHPDLKGAILPGTSILDGSTGLTDPSGHGTQMAGIAAATTNNSKGIAGVAFNGVKIIPVTVLDSTGHGQDHDIIEGIVWAADHGADVILMGFSNPDYSQSLQDAIDYAWSKGAVLVAAVGNDSANKATYPASMRGVMGISATDQNDALTGFSNYGQDVFLAAPGDSIYTTALNSSYSYFTGTSPSSAIVAGAAAFMKAVDPTITNGVIVDRLGDTTDQAGSASDPNRAIKFGKGRINMANAMKDKTLDTAQLAGAVGNSSGAVGQYTIAAATRVGTYATGSTGAAAAASFSLTVTAPTNGNTLIAVISTRSTTVANAVSSITQTGAAWTRAVAANGTAANGTTTEIWYAPNVAGAGTSITVTLASSVYAAAVVSEYNGVLAASSTDQSASSTNTTASTGATTGTTATTSQATDLLIAGVGLKSSGYSLGTPSNSFTSVGSSNSTNSTATNNARVYALERFVTATGAYTTGGTVSASSYWSGAIASFKLVPQVLPLTAWANVYAGAGTSGSAVTSTGTFNAGTGTNRILLVGFTADSGTTGTMTVSSVTYGGVTVIPIATTEATSNRSMSWIGYILDSQIPAGANSVAVNATYTGMSRMAIFAGSYQNAAQAAPVGTKASNTTSYGTSTTSISLAYAPFGISVVLANSQSNTSSTTYSATNTFSSSLWSSNASGSSNVAVSSIPITSGTDTIILSSLQMGRNSIVAVNIDQAPLAPTITTWPTATAITYGQTLASSTLSGGVASVPGVFTFTAPTTAPSAGSAAQSVTFTPTDSNNYNTASSTVSVTVNKATPSVTTWPTASAITYGQALASSALTGGASTPAGSIAFTTPSTVPAAGSASQSVTFTPTDSSNYNTASSTVSVTVNKATATITWPTASAITYGQTLVSSTLTGGASTPAGSFAFTTPSTAPSAGSASQSVTFTPTDTTNYNTATSTVNVSVNKATPSVTTWPTASAITYGQTLTSSTLSGGSANGTFAFATPSTAPSAGTYSATVNFTPTDSANYNTATNTVSVTVNKANPTVTTWPTASAISYGQTLASSTLSGGASTPAGSFAFTTPSTSPSAGNASQSVTFTPTDTANYNTATNNVNVTVNKAAATVTWPTASAITYGQTLTSSTLSGGSANGTFAFAAPSTAPTAGTYSATVNFTPTDSANFNTATSTVSVTVNKATTTVTLGSLSQTYTGTQLSATATTNPSGKTVTFTYNGSATAPTSAGSYTVVGTISDTNYLGSASGTLVIAKATPNVTTWPTASAITYGQTLTGSTLSGGASTPAGSFAFTTPSTAPSAGNASQSVTFTPTNAANYNTAINNINVTVNKATATVTWPTASAITYGQTLTFSTLSGGSVNGTFAFAAPSTAPAAGTYSATVNFTPTDSSSYNTATNTVSVTVNKATATVSLSNLNQTYSGSALTPTATTTPAGLTVTWANAPKTASGTYSATATISDSNYSGSANGSFVIAKADAVITWPTASTITYGQTLTSSTLSGGSVNGTFAFAAPSTAPAAGTYSATVNFTPTDSANYNTGSNTVSVTVNKAAATVSLSNLNQTYSGSALTPTAITTPSGLTVTWTNASNTAAGSYSVTATISDSNYQGSANGIFVIAKADATVTWPAASAITYEQKLNASTLSGGSTNGTFTFAAPSTAPAAGTYSATVNFVQADSAN